MNLISYILKKLCYLGCSLFIVITLTFILMKSIPGDPFQDEQLLPADIHQALLAHYGLDQPLYKQYGTYLKAILHGDLGPSFKYKDLDVNSIILEGFSVSAILGIEALFLALGLGVLLGMLAALKEGEWPDQAAIFFTTIGISVPSFLLATLLQYFLAIKLHLLPLALWESFSHTILPAISLAVLPTAFITRLIRAKMIEILQCDYIKTAKAKGLSTSAVLFKHALRNAFLPCLTYLGQLCANILIGSFVIEKIFSLPGLGNWFVNSVLNRDYTVIMGLTIFYSVLLLTMTFLVDIAYSILDPRIQLIKQKA